VLLRPLLLLLPPGTLHRQDLPAAVLLVLRGRAAHQAAAAMQLVQGQALRPQRRLWLRLMARPPAAAVVAAWWVRARWARRTTSSWWMTSCGA
jgi:hypothetical protein